MTELLAIERLSAGYGKAVVVNEVSLALAEGQSLAVLGRNGMGKTTLLNSIMGTTRHFGGSIRLDGREIAQLRPDQRAHCGIGWVPQERNIFRSLTVEENLTAVARPGPWTTARIYRLFPQLDERRRNLGDQLSGGEQQMLAIGRALALNPRVILLDEPTEGLAPILAQEVLAALQRLIREQKMAAIIVEQHARKILGMTDRAAILERGMVVREGTSAEILADRASLEAYLGVTASGLRRQALPNAGIAALGRQRSASPPVGRHSNPR